MLTTLSRQMTPFFHLFIAAFYFCISANSKFKSNGVPPFHYVLVSKNTHLHAKDDTFKPVRVDILFLYKIWYLLVYNTFCSQFENTQMYTINLGNLSLFLKRARTCL